MENQEKEDYRMVIQTELGLRIRYYRKQQKISQEKLAELASLHPTYIGQVERGEKNATMESIYHIAKGLGIPLSQLFTDIEDISRNENKKTFFPYDMYHRLMELSPQKQKQLLHIIDSILLLMES